MEAYPPKTFSRSVVQGERDRFESNRYISMMTDQPVIPSPPLSFVFLERRNERYGDEGNPFLQIWDLEERFFLFLIEIEDK